MGGATRWVAPDKALLQLSLRYKSDDQFWFSFFHKAGHILLHKKRDVFIENDKSSDEQEQEADAFAKNTLIPFDVYTVFLETVSVGHVSKESVKEFAAKLGIAPGIVVGRLQHDGHLPFTHLNGLKQKFGWNI